MRRSTFIGPPIALGSSAASNSCRAFSHRAALGSRFSQSQALIIWAALSR